MALEKSSRLASSRVVIRWRNCCVLLSRRPPIFRSPSPLFTEFRRPSGLPRYRTTRYLKKSDIAFSECFSNVSECFSNVSKSIFVCLLSVNRKRFHLYHFRNFSECFLSKISKMANSFIQEYFISACISGCASVLFCRYFQPCQLKTYVHWKSVDIDWCQGLKTILIALC